VMPTGRFSSIASSPLSGKTPLHSALAPSGHALLQPAVRCNHRAQRVGHPYCVAWTRWIST
jgi:hypothetical protein